jgi:fibro-slime domain-containing protein
MLKRVRLIFVFVFLAFFSGAFGQGGFIELDVIVRDFPVGYSGFEEFDSDLGSNGQCTEKNDARESRWIAENRICFSGSNYIPCSQGGTQLGYGQDNNKTNANGVKFRGYCNGPDKATNCSCNANGNTVSNGDCEWANPVGVTKGMVGNRLDYSGCTKDDEKGSTPIEEAINGRYCARPQKGNDACHSSNLQSWFTNSGNAKTYEDVIRLNQVGNGAFYEINYDYNTRTEWRPGTGLYDNGYFPLDKYGDSWGMQSLNIWCPPIGTGISYDLGEDCRRWKNAGTGVKGPKDPTAAQLAVNNGVPARLLHNYGFSMAGSGEFKFSKNADEEFQFIGDDDMWIFIDGDLVVDLGGTHLAAPAKINIRDYGNSKGWEDGSMHAINFYYLDRQTDGSNMKLRISISNLSPSRFGAPRILKAETVQKQDGTSETTIYVNNKIENLQNFINSGEFPIIIKKPGPNNPDLLAYRIEKIIEGPVNMGSEGYAYVITGQVCKNRNECGGSLILNSGDSLSFNVKIGQDVTDGGFRDPSGLGLSSESWYIKSTNGTPATTKSWAINTTNLPPIDFKPDVPDKTPVKPPFVIADGGGGGGDQGDRTVPGGSGGSVGKYDGGGKFPNITQVWDPSANGGAGGMVPISSIPGTGMNNSDVHGFGVVGKQIPPQRTGELILTVFPNTYEATYNDWYSEWQKKDSKTNKRFGLPPTVDSDPNAWWGLVKPNEKAEYGGYQFVKNGFPNESNTKGNIKWAPTRCTTIFDEKEEPRINCLNFSLVAKQPFQLAVTVYDQLGNFVTQYRETLTEQEFRNVVQAPNYISNINTSGASTGCNLPTPSNYGAPTTLTTNGLINVNVNIYPFSSEGRRFGNGVYIVKIDRVDLPFKDGIDPNDPTTRDPNTGNGYTCASAGGGNSTRTSPSFIRYHADQKFGWMRTNQK